MGLRITLIFAAICIFHNVGAKNFHYYDDLSGSSLMNGAAIDHEDDHYTTISGGGWQSSFTHHDVQNKISLRFDPADLTDFTSSFTTTVTFDLEYIDEDLNSHYEYNVALTVTFDPNGGAAMTETDVFRFSGGHRVIITNIAITGTNR